VAVREHGDEGGGVHDAGEVRRGDEAGADGDSLPGRGDAGADRAFALPGVVQGEGGGGAAADRADRRVRDVVAGAVQGEEVAGGGSRAGGEEGGCEVRGAAEGAGGEAAAGEGSAAVGAVEGERGGARRG